MFFGYLVFLTQTFALEVADFPRQDALRRAEKQAATTEAGISRLRFDVSDSGFVSKCFK